MNIENSFNFKELEKLHHAPQIPEESITALTRVFTMATGIVFSSIGIVLIYLLFVVAANGVVVSYTGLNFDFQEFIIRASNNDQAYVLELARKIGEIFIINLTASLFFLIFDNSFYSAVISESHNSFIEKLLKFFSILMRRGFHLLIAVTLKTIILLIGFLLFVIPGVIFWLGMLFIEYIIIFENKGFFEAWSKSNELMTGVKANFLTFISIAGVVLLPIALLKTFYNFDLEIVKYYRDHVINSTLIISTLVEMSKFFIYGIYFAATCLLYFKRVQVMDEYENEILGEKDA